MTVNQRGAIDVYPPHKRNNIVNIGVMARRVDGVLACLVVVMSTLWMVVSASKCPKNIDNYRRCAKKERAFY